MKIVLLYFFVLISFTTKSQIKINYKAIPNFDFEFHNKIIRDTNITNNFDFEKSGINNLWDFSNLPDGTLDTIYYLNPNQTPYFDTFPTSNLVRYFHDEIFGDQYYYLKFDTTSLNMLGSYSLVFDISNKNTINHFKPLKNRFKFPIEKGSGFDFEYNVKSPIFNNPSWALGYDSVYIKSHFNIRSKFIASGLIKLNTGTFPCLLEEIIQNSIDSSYSSDTCKNCPWISKVSGWGYGHAFHWYISNSTEPVATFYESLFNNIITIRIDSIKLSSVNNNIILGFNVFPNPANNTLFIENNLSQTSNYIISNMLGQQMQEGDLKKEIDISSLISGIYFLKITAANNETKTVKFIKQ
jgi:hypothetical protein